MCKMVSNVAWRQCVKIQFFQQGKWLYYILQNHFIVNQSDIIIHARKSCLANLEKKCSSQYASVEFTVV